ncbi:type II secretion system F family protein [Nesterenkonia sp. YGD6]|uniref:type II secretion system F family protein n=1 Tax=Nesterenkonia sp. YGD6 TaxID=2901231 RepID=UPI001F4C5A6B|nr:type II secretion system F family protein [Nesterenkonia sp. YGD6]MCH8563975.1 type II secretion system F family protein [Nesterenkonia sp. YGD6]
MAEGQVLPALLCALLVGLLIALVHAPAPAPLPAPASPRRRRRGAPASRASTPAEAPADRTPDAATLLDLTAAMLRAGAGIETAVQRLSQDVPGCAPLARVHRGLSAGRRWQDAWSGVDSQVQLREFGAELAFAHATGAPTVQLLELTAVQARRRRRQAVEEQAARLAVQMVLPLGLCFLPGFILLGVIPVVLGLVEELA